MDAWLKGHIVLVIPVNFISAVSGGNLHKAAKDKRLLISAVEAVDEGFRVMEALGGKAIPAGIPLISRISSGISRLPSGESSPPSGPIALLVVLQTALAE
ncbi:hypothetical protein [Paenibacillus sp. S150]|uniref:hypothetical protein n=1 Tax=Paenibacillus sp. S150 TaxID=2749826 RepID=UPI001C57C0FD|nr:hypothetical protein [Paenibacillus sp. S150]MBW4080641.1 hypothetical protein [Paenibacillus sp. S150]